MKNTIDNKHLGNIDYKSEKFRCLSKIRSDYCAFFWVTNSELSSAPKDLLLLGKKGHTISVKLELPNSVGLV